MTRFDLKSPLCFSAILIVCLAAAAPAVAQLTQPTERDQAISRRVSLFLERVHIRGAKPDDKMAEQFFELFIDSLDPQRVYFLQSDVDEFAKSKNKLDDNLQIGRVDFAFTVFKRFLKRIDARLELVKDLAKKEFDFEKDESISKDRSEAGFPKDDADLRELWRKRIKLSLLEKITEEVTLEDAREQVVKRYTEFTRRMHQIDNDELMQIFFTSATLTYDPHTTYMSPATLEDFEISMKLELEGIGAALMSKDGFTVVTEVIPGGAADEDGTLKPQDKIVAVAQGKEGEFVDVVEMKLSDVVKLIRGKKGTIVRLKVKQVETNDTIELKIVRAKVELKSREARGEIVEETIEGSDSKLRVGVVELPSFYMDMNAASAGKKNYKSTTRDVKQLIEGFKKEGNIDAVLLDLRRNSGGSLTEAIELTGLFIDKGPVVQIKSPLYGLETKQDLKAGQAWSGPLIVLTSTYSASASEIFAGAIQDYGRGIIVGDRATHGKGTVQQLLSIGDRRPGSPDLGAIKITISQFYRPSGASTQNLGVVPDIVLPSIRSHLDLGEAHLDNALAFDQIQRASFEKLSLVNDKMLKSLRGSSERRLAASEFFKKKHEQIQRFLKMKARKDIPLNKQRFVEDLKIVESGEEPPEKQDTKDDPVIIRDGYFDEIMAITKDYLGLLS